MYVWYLRDHEATIDGIKTVWIYELQTRSLSGGMLATESVWLVPGTYEE